MDSKKVLKKLLKRAQTAPDFNRLALRQNEFWYVYITQRPEIAIPGLPRLMERKMATSEMTKPV